jgi:mRNA-degrading endonuclease RelE of RelBE toxin-antitoxin system
MSYNVKSISIFEKQAKRLIKKYPSLKREILELAQSLKTVPSQGVSIGHSCYKIRLSVSSKGKGKSGGARVITNVVVTENTVYLIAIYDKSERETLSEKELAELLKFIPR